MTGERRPDAPEPVGPDAVILAADIGGTKTAAARVSARGRILDDRIETVPTPAAAGPAAVLRTVVELFERLGRDDAAAVGISTAGVVDPATGRIASATSSLPGWAGTAVAEELGAALARPVRVLNDGHAFGVGEAAYGHGRAVTAGRGIDPTPTLLLLAVGTGIGGAFVRGDEPLLGAHGVAGHVGHVPVPEAEGLPCPCGRTGHAEAIGGGAGLLAWYHRAGGDRTVASAQAVVLRAAEPGGADPLAARAVHRSAAAVGRVAGGLANVLDPDVVVLAGGLAQAGPPWLDAVRAAYDQTLMGVLAGLPLQVADGGVATALRGAARYAWRRTWRRIDA